MPVMHGRQYMVEYSGDFPNLPDQSRNFRSVMLWNGSGSQIAAGDVVGIDLSVTTKGIGRSIKTSPITTQADDDSGIGGALRAIPNLSWGEVVVEGIQTLVNCDATVTAGNQLACMTTAGRLHPATADPATREVVLARALTAAVANQATVEWFGQVGY